MIVILLNKRNKNFQQIQLVNNLLKKEIILKTRRKDQIKFVKNNKNKYINLIKFLRIKNIKSILLLFKFENYFKIKRIKIFNNYAII